MSTMGSTATVECCWCGNGSGSAAAHRIDDRASLPTFAVLLQLRGPLQLALCLHPLHHPRGVRSDGCRATLQEPTLAHQAWIAGPKMK